MFKRMGDVKTVSWITKERMKEKERKKERKKEKEKKKEF